MMLKISRNDLRETMAQDSWCQAQEFKPKIVDCDKVTFYTVSYQIEGNLTKEQLEALYIAPLRLAIVREFVKRKIDVQIGEPSLIHEGTELTVRYPVLELSC